MRLKDKQTQFATFPVKGNNRGSLNEIDRWHRPKFVLAGHFKWSNNTFALACNLNTLRFVCNQSGVLPYILVTNRTFDSCKQCLFLAMKKGFSVVSSHAYMLPLYWVLFSWIIHQTRNIIIWPPKQPADHHPHFQNSGQAGHTSQLGTYSIKLLPAVRPALRADRRDPFSERNGSGGFSRLLIPPK
jgi:hypothetical protein